MFQREYGTAKQGTSSVQNDQAMGKSSGTLKFQCCGCENLASYVSFQVVCFLEKSSWEVFAGHHQNHSDTGLWSQEWQIKESTKQKGSK